MATHSAPVHGAGVRDLPAPSGIRAPVVATAAWIAGLVVLVLVFVTVRGFHVGDTTSVTRLGRQLVFNDATAPNARVLGDALQLAPMGSRPAVADLTVKSFPAAEAGAVMVDTSPLPQDVELALLWVRRSDPHVIHEQILRVEHGAPATTLLTQNPEWRGEIVSVALGVKNASKQAVTIHEVRLRPLGIGIVLADLLASWSYAGGWDGRSINVVFGGREEQPTYLPALGFAAAVIVSLIAYFASRRRGRSTPVAWLTVPFVASWLLLDLRWQRELFEQVGQTHQQFAGKSSIDREAAM